MIYGDSRQRDEAKRNRASGKAARADEITKISGGDALGGHTRSHPEHDG